MIVRERPRLNPENPDELLVPIIDSTSTGHGPADVRKKGGATGVGQGLIGLQLDSNGSPVAYRWSGGRSPKAQTTTIRVGRLAQKPQP